MTLKPVTSTSQTLPIGGIWVIEVQGYDAAGCLADDTVTVTVTLPAGGTATPTVESLGSSAYRASYAVGTAGRYTARAVGSLGAVDFTVNVMAIVTGLMMPTVDDLDEYLLAAGGHSYTDEQLQAALSAEAAAQARACRIPADYTDDLRRALLRRAQRALGLERIPLASEIDGETGFNQTPAGLDREIRRYEAPYRRLIVG